MATAKKPARDPPRAVSSPSRGGRDRASRGGACPYFRGPEPIQWRSPSSSSFLGGGGGRPGMTTVWGPPPTARKRQSSLSSEVDASPRPATKERAKFFLYFFVVSRFVRAAGACFALRPAHAAIKPARRALSSFPFSGKGPSGALLLGGRPTGRGVRLGAGGRRAVSTADSLLSLSSPSVFSPRGKRRGAPGVSFWWPERDIDLRRATHFRSLVWRRLPPLPGNFFPEDAGPGARARPGIGAGHFSDSNFSFSVSASSSYPRPRPLTRRENPNLPKQKTTLPTTLATGLHRRRHGGRPLQGRQGLRGQAQDPRRDDRRRAGHP